MSMAVELYPHQEKAVSEMHNGCILYADMGLGKTITAAAYYMRNEAPKDVIVITTAKKRDSLDWQAEFARFGVGSERTGTVAGVLTVDSWNNLPRYRDRTGCFFIFDEQRVVGSGKWVKDYLRIAKGNRWILLTATPGDTWIDYIPVFVANDFYKNRSEFLRQHVVYNRFSKFPKVERYIGVTKLLRLRDRVLVHMPLAERHTTRLIETVPVEYDQTLFERVLNKRWHVYESRPLRDVAEMFLVLRKVANSDTSRLEAVRKLMLAHPRLVVFYNFDYELELLRSLAISDAKSSGRRPIRKLASTESSNGLVQEAGLSSSVPAVEQPSTSSSGRTSIGTKSPVMSGSTSDLVIAEWNGHKHEPIPDTDSWVYLVQYQAGSEGWNCIETDATVFYSLTYSYKNWYQAFGRIDRLNTPFTTLHYYVLMSDSVIDKAIMRSLKGKKSFNESRWLNRISTTRSQE